MVQLENISFSYGQDNKVNSLTNIDLTIKKGEIVLFCGESGCGKTTITRLINGLIPHYYTGTLKGKVHIQGTDIRSIPLYETAKIVGSVFQNPRSQFFNVDTTSELTFGCENMGLPAEHILQRLQQTVEEFEISSLLNRSIFNLSGGEKQKIACASVSVSQPEIMVLDEPSSNLDMYSIDDLRKLITTWKKQGKTVVIAEHRLHYLKDLVDRIIYMKDGCIVKEYSIEEMKLLKPSTLAELGLRPMFLEQIELFQQEPETKNEEIQFENFHFCYDSGKQVLNVPSLSVPNRSIVAIVGANGAGKSTFARCLCGLEKQCKGKMHYKGNCYKRKNRIKNCYMVMQDVNHQLFTQSVLEEALISMEDQNETHAEEILDSLDLLQFKERHPVSLSGGQKQRVAIASAVASKRNFIILDEPTSGLDFHHMIETWKVLKKLQEHCDAIFVISHDIEFILRCCSHVLHFDNGTIINNYPLDQEGRQKIKQLFVMS